MLTCRRLLLLIRRIHFIDRAFSSHPINSFSLRTHNCGELRLCNVGERVKLYGWLSNKRIIGKFIVLRDAYGSVQAILPKNLANSAKDLPFESVIHIKGTVVDRGKDRNKEMVTGDIEVLVEELEVLNRSESQLPVWDASSEQIRLTHRYLNLRSAKMQRALRLRARVSSRIRRYLEDCCGFIDVQTPTLAHMTPGGAAEFPVPATENGQCFSLPQSPQLYKQLLMCGSVDRYYQLAICYRDEDARSDRQLEFTQLDLEMSFTSQEMLLSLIENIIIHSWPDDLPKPSVPFCKLSYHEAMRRFGTDKPDIRFEWELVDCPPELTRSNEYLQSSTLKFFIARDALRHLTPENLANWQSRIDTLPNRQHYLICGKLDQRLLDAFPDLFENTFFKEKEMTVEDAIVLCWGDEKDARLVLGTLRNVIAETIGLRSSQRFDFVWVQNFPLFSRNEETGLLESSHHPFTAPVQEHLDQLYQRRNLEQIEAQHYDLVLNGVEIGGGSIRIHNSDLQRLVLEQILELKTDEIEHFLTALKYGAPPHGGFALGLERYIAILNSNGETDCTIRDVIAFPKASSGRCLMTKSPMTPSKALLERYGLTRKT